MSAITCKDAIHFFGMRAILQPEYKISIYEHILNCNDCLTRVYAQRNNKDQPRKDSCLAILQTTDGFRIANINLIKKDEAVYQNLGYWSEYFMASPVIDSEDEVITRVDEEEQRLKNAGCPVTIELYEVPMTFKELFYKYGQERCVYRMECEMCEGYISISKTWRFDALRICENCLEAMEDVGLAVR